jgi:MoaA/NifB/PqqE/SkfB family radical SAM enzyme
MIRAPLIMELCSRIRARNMNGILHSNGTLFKREHAAHLIDIGWDRVFFSLDGPTAEINDAIRDKNCFNRVVETLRLIRDLKRDRKTAFPRVSINFVVTNRNHECLEAMTHVCHEYGVEAISATALFVQGEECSQFHLSSEQFASLPQHVLRAQKSAQRLGIDNNFASMLAAQQTRDELGHVPAAPPPAEKPPESEGMTAFLNARCYEPFLSLAILAEHGKAGPCCTFNEDKVPSARDHSLEELWLGPYMQRMRKIILRNKALPKYCELCCSVIDDRTNPLREKLCRLSHDPLKELGYWGYTRDLARRLRLNLTERGLRETLHRTRQWIHLHRHPYD